jgi:hypothetical protein
MPRNVWFIYSYLGNNSIQEVHFRSLHITARKGSFQEMFFLVSTKITIYKQQTVTSYIILTSLLPGWDLNPQSSVLQAAGLAGDAPERADQRGQDQVLASDRPGRRAAAQGQQGADFMDLRFSDKKSSDKLFLSLIFGRKLR